VVYHPACRSSRGEVFPGLSQGGMGTPGADISSGEAFPGLSQVGGTPGQTVSSRAALDMDESVVRALKGLRCLVADDNGVNTMVLRRMLLAFQISCDVATNGAEAVAACQEAPDIVFMVRHWLTSSRSLSLSRSRYHHCFLTSYGTL